MLLQRMISGTSGEDGASITPQSGDILNLPTIDWTNVPDFGAMAPQASTMHQVGIGELGRSPLYLQLSLTRSPTPPQTNRSGAPKDCSTRTCMRSL